MSKLKLAVYGVVVACKVADKVHENYKQFKKDHGTVFNYMHGVKYINE